MFIDDGRTITLAEAVDELHRLLYAATKARKIANVRKHLYEMQDIIIGIDEAVSGDIADQTDVEIW